MVVLVARVVVKIGARMVVMLVMMMTMMRMLMMVLMAVVMMMTMTAVVVVMVVLGLDDYCRSRRLFGALFLSLDWSYLTVDYLFSIF